MKTGIFPGVPFEEYLKIPAINKSGLDLVEKSPLHYWSDSLLNPNRVPQKKSDALSLGSAAHTALLEPHLWDKRFIVAPRKLDLRFKEDKAIYAELEATGLEILYPEEAEKAQKIAARARSSAAGEVLFNGGKSEVTIIWKDRATDAFCKARFDYLSDDYAFALDLKSTEDASPDGFAKTIASYNYHRQAAWYFDGLSQLTGKPDTSFVFVAAEKKEPFAVAFYEASNAMIVQGREENRELLVRYAECLSKDVWPSYPEEISPIDLPRWRQRRDLIPNELETF